MKKSKITRIFSVAAAAVCMVSGLKFMPLFDDADAAGAMNAYEITQDMKIGWNLGNSFDATGGSGLDTETSWGNPKTTQAMIKAVKAKGFNTIRIPTSWYLHLDNDNKIEPEWLDRVQEVIDWCIAEDMYVILNMHHENFINVDVFTDETLKTALTKSTAIWTQLSERFASYDQHLVFECMNEARQLNNPEVSQWGNGGEDNGYTWNYVNTLNENFVKIVRNQGSEENKNRLLMLPGYCASSNVAAIRAVDIPEDSGNIALSVHAYLPYFFTMATDEYANHEFPGKSGWGEDYEGALKQFFDSMDTIIDEKNTPIVIGEFSASDFGNTEARTNWATYYITQAKKVGIPCVLWDNNASPNGNNYTGEEHDYLNRSDCSWYEQSEPVVDAMMKVLADDSIVWGDSSAPTVKHDDMSTGKYIIENSQDIDASIDEKNCTTPIDLTWKDIEGKDIAIKYTGDTPVIAFTDAAWDGWKEIVAYDVDKNKGIAYFSADQIKAAWGEDSIDTLAKFFVKTMGKTTVEGVALINASGAVVTPPEDETKKYPLDLANKPADQPLILKFKGEAGSSLNGCVGYMGEDWMQIEWEATIGADGTATVEIKDLPADVKNAEAQIWWSDDKNAEMTEYTFDSAQTTNPTTPSEVAYGDANCDGKVEIADATLILQFLTNKDEYSLTEQGMKNADVTGDNDGVTAQDALVIQQIDAGIYKVTDLPLKSA